MTPTISGYAVALAILFASSAAFGQAEAEKLRSLPQGQSTDSSPTGSIRFDAKGVDFGPWLKEFFGQVKQNWPALSTGVTTQRGTVEVTFYATRDGTIEEVKITRSSGKWILDSAARNALVGLSPVPPVPGEYPDDRVFFTVTFSNNPGETPQNPRVQYYEVTGNSAKELRESLNQHRPVGPDDKRHDAVTTVQIGWRYSTNLSEEGCSVAGFDVSSEVETVLPNWASPPDAPQDLLARWRSYHAALIRHEEAHKQIALAAAAAIRDAGPKVPRQQTCKDIGRVVDEMGHGLLAEARRRHQQFDAETDHGQLQGARFP